MKLNPPFEAPRVLKGTRLALLCAFEWNHRSFHRWRLESKHLVWSAGDENFADQPGTLQGFGIAEKFLRSKQMFFGRREPVPSFPPTRALLPGPLHLSIEMAKGPLIIPFDVVVSWFESQATLTALLFTEFAEVSVDDLIYIKEAKWFASNRQYIWGTDQRVAGEEEKLSAYSFQAAVCRLLASNGARELVNHDWPVFDLIELHNIGPSVGLGPNAEDRLSLAEHWGLLWGDEGFRLIDSSEADYEKYLTDSCNRFRGRDAFLYNFCRSSCLAFRSKDETLIRREWESFYRNRVGYIERLSRYIGFVTRVPCLTDGIPLLIEIALLRYIELCKVDALLESEEKSSILWFLWTRLRGMTSVERAVSLLQRLDLYQDSSLWIIGGPYADQLFDYSRIRARIDRSIAQSQIAGADIRLFYVAFTSLIVAGIAAVATVIPLVKDRPPEAPAAHQSTTPNGQE